MIKPWVFEFFPELSGATSAAALEGYFKRYLDLWVRDETLGFEGIFFSEHHFGGSFSASPNLLVAATAVRTTRLRLGVMGIVTPLHTPARILEEIGVLDHICGGRLEIGTAIGVPQELSQLGMSMEEARDRNTETLAILDAALTADTLTHTGARFTYDAVRLLPPRAQRPERRTWTTIISVESARASARRRSRICTGFHATEQVRALFDAYRSEARACDFQVGPEDVALRRRVVVARTEAEAKRLSVEMAERLRSYVARDSRLTSGAVPDTPSHGAFALSDDEFIYGVPGRVAETIIAQCRRVGAGHMLAVLHWGAGIDEVAAAHALFGQEVVPVLRGADVH